MALILQVWHLELYTKRANSPGLLGPVGVAVFECLLFRADDDDAEEDKVLVHGEDLRLDGELCEVPPRVCAAKKNSYTIR